MLQLSGVCKTYGPEPGGYIALKNIDITIPDGEFFCLLGPSGCGKSTLLNIMAGFESASVGSATFNDAPIAGAGRSVRRSHHDLFGARARHDNPITREGISSLSGVWRRANRPGPIG